MPSQEQVIQAIKTVYDPEIPVNVYDLGLIYDVETSDDAVAIKMSLTSAGCPSAQEIPHNIKMRVAADCGVAEDRINVAVVWEPPWTPARISADGKKILGIDDEDDDDGLTP